MFRPAQIIVGFFAVLLAITVAAAGELRLIAWNVESGGADPETVSEDITDLDGYDVWGLSEVDQDDAEMYAEAAAEGEWNNVEYVLGTTGGNDRLLIMWNPAKVRMIEALELMEFRAQTGRAPLVVKLQELPNGPQFWFMLNHLHRGSPAKRMEQTLGVRGWMSEQTTPVFAMGDWNYDYAIPNGPGNPAFNAMSEAVDLRWIRPPEFVRTQSSFNSVLDMLWINQEALAWNPRSKIIQRSTDFQPVQLRSDHRPVDAKFNTNPLLADGTSPAALMSITALAATPTGSASSLERAARARRSALAAPGLGSRPPSTVVPGIESTTISPGSPAADSRAAATSDAQILRQLEALRQQVEALERLVRDRR
jgi:hypothetical protein